MGNDAFNLATLACDAVNFILFKIFSSIDYNAYSNLDSILFINSDIVNSYQFGELFGSDSGSGLLLLANSLICGVVLFYVIQFALSHLIYSKIDSVYQFLFKCIIFVICMNSSLWICERIIDVVSLVSESICEIGSWIHGTQISFSNLITQANSFLYNSFENFDVFSFDGILALCSCIRNYVYFNRLFYPIYHV